MYHVICHVTNTSVVVSLEALVEICDYHSYSELRIHQPGNEDRDTQVCK